MRNRPLQRPGKATVRKTRDVYALLADFGDGFGLRETGRWTDSWEEMRQIMEDHRAAGEAKRYSYRKRRIKIQTEPEKECPNCGRNLSECYVNCIFSN